jgi:hypothetical protein
MLVVQFIVSLSPRGLGGRAVLLPASGRVREGLARIVLLAFLMFLSARLVAAQATVEYGHAVAAAGSNLAGLAKAIDSTLSSVKKPDSTLTPDKKSGAVPPSEEASRVANRRALEQHAGKDGAKLTLKSVPGKASVTIDGKSVGLTPLILTLAPGAYKVEMLGPRMEFGKLQVNLRAQETREVELPLSPAPQYPTHVWLR